jgi:hypothetical protein
MKKFLLLAGLALVPVLANADEAPAAAGAAAVETIAPPSCSTPDIPSRNAGYDQTVTKTKKKDTQEDFQTAYQNYSTCMKAYIDLQADMSKKHIAAANAAVKAVNDFNAKVTASQN